MRVALLSLIVVVVFGAMLIFDTAALIRLTVFCVTGGCGVRPLWIAAGAGGIALVAMLSLRQSPVSAKSAKKPRLRAAPRGTAPRKAPPRRKAKAAK
jgi:hypothetical protein